MTSDDPQVVRDAQKKEKARQDKEWTNENIQAHPDLWLRDAIQKCDDNLKKIEVQELAFMRLRKQHERRLSEAIALENRYNTWAQAARAAYKAQATPSWPIIVNGFTLSEEDFKDTLADALERVRIAKDKKDASNVILKKIEIRCREIKEANTVVRRQRQNLEYQLEKIQMNQAFDNINEISDIINEVEDMSVELSGSSDKLSLDDMTAPSPNTQRDQEVMDFLK